jgi:hypothetical protein
MMNCGATQRKAFEIGSNTSGVGSGAAGQSAMIRRSSERQPWGEEI